MSARATFALPAGRRTAQVLAALRRTGYRPGPPEPSQGETLYFDTQGGALFKAGERLCASRGSWRLEPECGPLAAAVSQEARGAALLPYAWVRWQGKACVLEGPLESRFSALFAKRAFALPEGPWGATETVLEVVQTCGGPEELERLSAVLRGVAHLSPAEADPLTAALVALGRALPGAPIPAGMRVTPEDLLCVAGRKVLAQQAYRMGANAEGAAHDRDVEFVHDLRVATRRARSALRLFAPALGARRCESLRQELAWAARLSSPVRDLDVFLEVLPAHLEHAGVEEESRRWLSAWLGARRKAAQEVLAAGLATARFGRLLSRVEGFARSPAPRAPRGAAALPVTAAAHALIERAAKGVRKAGKAVGSPPSPAALHALRIRFKRLRYTCEFFRDALEGEAGAYLSLLVEVQDCLGAHQDATAAEVLLREAAAEAARSGCPPQLLMDLGGLLQVQRHEAQACRDAFGPLWKSFKKKAHPGKAG